MNLHRKLVIIGATGFTGRVVARHFRKSGWETIGLTRTPGTTTECDTTRVWNPVDPYTLAATLNGADAVLNLAGKSVDCRYTPKNRTEILESRVRPTRAIAKAIRACPNPPNVWLNAASATIYDEAFERPQTEANGIIGTGFSVDVCRAWERAFFQGELPDTRRVALRTALVLGHARNSVYPRLARLARFGLGGAIDRGDQIVSWIHERDFARAIAFLIDDDEIKGAVNLAAPAPLPNREFMKTLRQQLGRRFGLPIPKWLLDIGAFFLRTEPELVRKSRFVVPERLLKKRFVFEFPFLDEALANLSDMSVQARTRTRAIETTQRVYS